VHRGAVEECIAGVGLDLLWGGLLLQGFVGQAVPAARRCRLRASRRRKFSPYHEDMAAAREAIEGGSGERIAAEHLGRLSKGRFVVTIRLSRS
jgi:hypothetical protein